MKTKEELITEIEFKVSAKYGLHFPLSQLRENTEDVVETLKALFNALKTSKKQTNTASIFDSILDIVLDDREEYKEYARAHSNLLTTKEWDSLVLIKNCDELIRRFNEEKPSKGTMTVLELSQKYEGKYIVFNGDEDGCQIIYVDNIHLNDNGFGIDGVMIELVNTNHENGDGILTYEIKDFPFGDLNYVDEDQLETTDDVDSLLQCPPVDWDADEFPSKVLTNKQVIDTISSYLNDIFEDNGLDIFI